jgi:hypothetical protein
MSQVILVPNHKITATNDDDDDGTLQQQLALLLQPGQEEIVLVPIKQHFLAS